MAIRQTVNPFRVLLRKLPKPLRNPYFLMLAVFSLLMIFVDKHDLLTQIKLGRSLNRLENDKAYYQQKIEEAKKDQQNIEQDKEKFAREKYHLHEADEEVFIIQENE